MQFISCFVRTISCFVLLLTIKKTGQLQVFQKTIKTIKLNSHKLSLIKLFYLNYTSNLP